MSDAAKPGYLIFDIETIPDGQLVADIKYPDLHLTAHEAVMRAQDDARATSSSGSDFLPLTFHVPVGICVLKLDAHFKIMSVTCLDEPLFRPEEMVARFWKGVELFKSCLVSFNGRKFDIPVLELAAFRYGIQLPWHFKGEPQQRSFKNKIPRGRYSDHHLDLFEFFSNYNSYPLAGGLNLLAKLIGIPGKFEMSGANVYSMIQAGKYSAVNEYCSFDVLDTYFVFLRTRVLTGALSLQQEEQLRREAHHWLKYESQKQPHLTRYLEKWQLQQPLIPIA